MALFAKKEQATLRITGMHCANCQRAVGDALRAVPGVAAATVDLVFHRANVTYDPTKATMGQLVAAVRGVGYEAAPVEARA